MNENNITIYEEDSEYGGKHLSREHTFTLCIASKTRRTTARPKDQPPKLRARKTKTEVVCMEMHVCRACESCRMYIRCLPVGVSEKSTRWINDRRFRDIPS